MNPEQILPSPTAGGLIMAGELKVGDQVFTAKGTPTTILEIQRFTPEDLYHVRFSDNETFDLSGDLRLPVTTGNFDDMTIASIRDLHGLTGIIKSPLLLRPLEYSETRRSPLHIDPYHYGLIFAGRLSTWEVGDVLKSNGYFLQMHSGHKPPRAHFTCWLNAHYTVPPPANRSHVQDYLYASPTVRWEFFRGLVDSDASFGRDGRLIFQVKNDPLKLEVYRVLSSSLCFNVKSNAYKNRYGNGLDQTCAFQVYQNQAIGKMPARYSTVKFTAKMRKFQFKQIMSIIKIPHAPKTDHIRLITESKIIVIGHYCTIITR